MKVDYRRSFVKDLRVLDQKRQARVREIIQLLESAASLREVPQLKPLQGRAGFFRIRLGDFRVGLAMVDDEVILVRCLDRKDFYRHFP